MPGDCDPIPKEYPPGSSERLKACIDTKYDAYLLGLQNCQGGIACCKDALSNYLNARQACIDQYPPSEPPGE